MKKNVFFVIGLISFSSLKINGQNLYVPLGSSGISISSNANVGIGISVPTRTLDIVGSASNGNYTTLLKLGTSDIAYGGSGGAIEFAAKNNSGRIDPVGVIAADLKGGGANTQTGDLRFLTSLNGQLQDRMRLTSTGILKIENEAVNGNYTTLLKLGTNNIAYGGSGGAIEFAAKNNSGNIDPVGVIAASLTGGSVNAQTGDLRFLTSLNGQLQDRMRLTSSGLLDVTGTIRAQEVKVCLNQGCDFVFKKDYKLMNLNELEKFVTTRQHLPEIASEKEMIENGLNMKEFQMKLLQKMEEMTLYIIEQNKKNEKQDQELKMLKAKIKKMNSIKR